MYKKFYSKFLGANKDRLHFAAHSHHFWPDITQSAHNQYWEDSCRFVDDKWNLILGEKKDHLSELISREIACDFKKQIAFAPNTAELLFRLLSCLDWSQDIHILASKHEFHTFRRFKNRLSEMKNFHFDLYEPEDFEAKIKQKNYDLVFFSRVFFNTGKYFKEWQKIIPLCGKNTKILIDDYHGFKAIPIDLSSFQDRVFYMSGGYKYAQGGEGICFLHVPTNLKLRPFYTGWFADFASLESMQTSASYDEEPGFAMSGATLDFTAMYRLIASLEFSNDNGITTQKIHAYITGLQDIFLKNSPLGSFVGEKDANYRAHFLSFEIKNAKELAQALKNHGLMVDYRANYLRFGFGLYHDEKDVLKALEILKLNLKSLKI